MLHIFVDESGVIGSTENFVIAFAFFPDAANYKKCVDKAKSETIGMHGKNIREIHFHKLNPLVKKDFLRCLVEVDGHFGYIHVNNSRLNEKFKNHPDNNLMYNLMLFYLIENFVKSGFSNDHIVLYVDQRSSNKNIKRKLSSYLPQKINPLLDSKRLYVRWEKSHNSRGIQCADSISGSVYRKLAKNDSQYYNIIKHNFVVKRNNLFGKY